VVDRARPPGFWNHVAFAVLWVLLGGFLRGWFRLRIENRPRLQGAYVLAPNHTSYLDPLLLGAASRRRISFLMTEVVYRSPWTGWFYRWNRALPLSVRGGNRDTLRAARSVLQQGRVLGVFPEGGISRDGGLMLGNPGAVSLVLQEKVAVVPVGIVGAYAALPVHGRFPWPRKIRIRFGDPIQPEELASAGTGRKDRLQAATRLIMERIAALTGGTARETELERARTG
jgi:1-acyl-sn-glycerol-3-phosphate acyltransferase